MHGWCACVCMRGTHLLVFHHLWGVLMFLGELINSIQDIFDGTGYVPVGGGETRGTTPCSVT